MSQENQYREETYEASYKDEWRDPPLYKVILHNDDYTTMDFVVQILMSIFRKNEEEAKRIMLTVHKSQKAIVGRYTREIAEMKVEQTINKARSEGFPLLCTFEPCDTDELN